MAALAPSRRQETIRTFKGVAKSSSRAFSCSQCNATFNRSAHLRRHLSAHNGEKPYSCDHCHLSSSRKDVIVRHMRNFHTEEAAEARGNSPRNASADQAQVQTRSMSQSEFDMTDPQPSTTAAVMQTQLPPPMDKTLPARNSLQTPRLMAGEQLRTGTPGNGGYEDLDLYAADFTFLNDGLAPGDQIIDFLPGDQVPDPSLWQIFEPAAVLSNTAGPQQDLFRPSPTHPPAFSSPSGRDSEHSEPPFLVDQDLYDEARGNLNKFDRGQKLADFRMPSKYALGRFLKAFFEHMAPHLPIIHRPSFDVASVPSPLLLSLMACGAIYSSEQETASEMYDAAVQLMSEASFPRKVANFEPCGHTQPSQSQLLRQCAFLGANDCMQHENIASTGPEENPFQLWELQTNILLSYFAVYAQTGHMRRKAFNTFSYTTKLAREAIQELSPNEPPDYAGWIRQESICRCIASVNILGAAMNSASEDQNFHLPDYETKIRLPSTRFDWLKEQQSWDGPPAVLYASDVVENIFRGIKPEIQAHEYTFLTLVSAALSHICSFEMLTKTKHPEIYAAFTAKMSGPLQLLYDMWNEQIAGGAASGALPTPLIQCTRSMLDSAFYHLHGSEQLAGMTRLLDSPDLLDHPNEMRRISELARAISLEKALIRAAASLSIDCRLGLRYVQKVAPHRFAPLSATAVTEGGLLLYWYLQFQQSKIPVPEVDALLDEVKSEVENLQMTRPSQFALLPLAASAELLQESSVWQWPPTLTAKIRRLITRIKDSSPA